MLFISAVMNDLLGDRYVYTVFSDVELLRYLNVTKAMLREEKFARWHKSVSPRRPSFNY